MLRLLLLKRVIALYSSHLSTLFIQHCVFTILYSITRLATEQCRVFGFQTIRRNEKLWKGDLKAIYEYYKVNEHDKTQLTSFSPSGFEYVDADTEQAYNRYMATAWHLLTRGMD